MYNKQLLSQLVSTILSLHKESIFENCSESMRRYLGLLVLIVGCWAQTDDTITPETFGHNVVEASIEKIRVSLHTHQWPIRAVHGNFTAQRP